jgi:hypothetical protein
MNYYAQGGQAHGLKSLTGHKIQTKDGVPSFGIGGAFQRNIMKPLTNAGMSAVKATQNLPGIKQVSDVSTQAFKPIDQAFVGLDKAVGKAIPGGWGTIAQTVAAMTPGMQPLAVGLGALNGSGVMRKGGSFNLQGAMIGGATAYATSELGEYLRAAGGAPDAALLPVSETGSAVGAGGVNAATGEIGSNLAGNASGMLVDPSSVTSANTAALNSLSASMDAGAGAGLQVAPPPSIGSQIMSGNFGDAISQAGTNIGNAATSAGDYIFDAGKAVANAPSDIYQAGLNAKDAVVNYDYGGTLDRVGQGMSDTGTGIKNVFTGNINPAAAAAVKSGATMAPAMSTAGTIYGVMSLSDQEAQLDYLKQQKAAGNLAQAEYDQAVAEIASQRNYASDVVSKNPFNTNPSRDTSIGDTYYGRSNEADNLYSRLTGEERLYAIGGSIDDESGMDEARGMMQGNLQKGLFGRGYADGGQIKGYAAGGMPDPNQFASFLTGANIPRFGDQDAATNPFTGGGGIMNSIGANLPPMGGALGAAGQQPSGGFNPFRNHIFDSTNTTTEQDIMGGNRNGVSGGLSNIFPSLGGNTPFSTSTLNATPQPLGGQFAHNQVPPQVPTGSIFNSSTYQSTGMSPNSGSSSGTYPGGYGGAGGSGGAFPLEGQYGIVKMAAGGMAPRFLSGGGDGMSDDIPATINGNQEARLADGEFVVPADVVSHLGNGSSKAGAKQLYSMMDKVRSARTGRKSQGKQINPRKYLPA